jgi:demethylmenaquinone methyltransferase / 2-methoxy-6-polyprenyl-1,4-benzoquinol methylase
MNPNSSTATSHEHFSNHFGFQPVDAKEKMGKVQSVFHHVATRYDIMNDIMSLGLHHAWKNRLIDALRPFPHIHLLDMAGGTGDIAFRFLQRGGGQVTIADLNQNMLDVGKTRAIDMNLDHARIIWQQENAESLSFATNTFDAYSISFGIRNVTHLHHALSEAHRVLKIGGHFLCLEFSMPTQTWLQRIYDAYSFHVIPALGNTITGDKEAYQYLVESIRQFPTPTLFSSMMKEAGFHHIRTTSMTGGVVTLYSGWKI